MQQLDCLEERVEHVRAPTENVLDQSWSELAHKPQRRRYKPPRGDILKGPLKLVASEAIGHWNRLLDAPLDDSGELALLASKVLGRFARQVSESEKHEAGEVRCLNGKGC